MHNHLVYSTIVTFNSKLRPKLFLECYIYWNWPSSEHPLLSLLLFWLTHSLFCPAVTLSLCPIVNLFLSLMATDFQIQNKPGTMESAPYVCHTLTLITPTREGKEFHNDTLCNPLSPLALSHYAPFHHFSFTLQLNVNLFLPNNLMFSI